MSEWANSFLFLAVVCECHFFPRGTSTWNSRRMNFHKIHFPSSSPGNINILHPLREASDLCSLSRDRLSSRWAMNRTASTFQNQTYVARTHPQHPHHPHYPCPSPPPSEKGTTAGAIRTIISHVPACPSLPINIVTDNVPRLQGLSLCWSRRWRLEASKLRSALRLFPLPVSSWQLFGIQ